MLAGAGMYPFLETTVGFGPFTFLNRNVFGDARAIAVNGRLESRARRHHYLRRHGWHYIVAASKRGSEDR